MPDQDFDLDRSITEAWQQFTGRLSEVISVIADGELTIGTLSSSADAGPFVRYAVAADRPDQVIAEAASNAELGEGFQLDVAQLEALEQLGWQPPSTEGEHPSPHFTIVRPQEQSLELAEIGVRTLRDVYGVQHPVFLAPDHLAEVLQGSVPTEQSSRARRSPFDDSDLVAIIPQSRDHLDDLIGEELRQMFGHEAMRDSEGDFAIRVGSTMVFIRSTPDAEEVLLFSALVHEVAGRSRAVEVLNDLNVEARHGRFALHRDRVFVQVSMLAHPFVPAHLHQALRMISQVADGIDDDLAAKLHGRTTFQPGVE
ncbi:T3SS (YopN, CesT) and YbjN peptide-binding chaperone 1 [Aestuariimicrobium soli]|uniref:T3SS (YopN, CesT) and YbjN peptide-binding chaperone 1 n=1 Tax=Aestuariimicrobium soli TaxID=2035834 RepID=UPI003EBFB5BA